MIERIGRKAVAAVARKFAVLLHGMWRDGSESHFGDTGGLGLAVGTGAGDRDVSPAAVRADRVRELAAPTLLMRILRPAIVGPRRER